MEPKGMKPPMPEGMGMPPMMQQMMGGMKEFNPMAMCECACMMGGGSRPSELPSYGPAEVRHLFEAWTRSVEDEIQTLLKSRGRLDLHGIAAELKTSPETVLYFVNKLAREGKVPSLGVKESAAGGCKP